MNIEQEKFDSLKELSEIQMQIAQGRSLILALGVELEQHMKLREDEALDRVAKVLKESQEALQKISLNHQSLAAYRSELQAYAIELQGFSSTLSALFQDFSKRMSEADADMKVHHKDVSEVLRQIKVERVSIEEDRKQLARERQQTNDGMKLLASQRAALQSAWDHLKVKQ